MLPTIRTFRNTDVKALCKVWNSHFGDLGSECRIDPLRLELSSLAKPHFNARDLLVAEFDEQVVGFLHLGRLSNSDMSDTRTDAASIAALCIVPCDGEDSIAVALIGHAEQLLAERSTQVCVYKPMLPDCLYYLGMGPADSMIGATTSERRGCNWVTAAGYVPTTPTTQWELQLSHFQPPIDRLQIQIRRGAHVDRQVDEPDLRWIQACVLGHTEPTYFQLTSRTERRVLLDALFWSMAAELQTSRESIIWLWPISIPDGEQGADQAAFLLGECCRQMQSERVEVVRTVTSASDSVNNRILRRLGFAAEQSGMVFHKQLT